MKENKREPRSGIGRRRWLLGAGAALGAAGLAALALRSRNGGGAETGTGPASSAEAGTGEIVHEASSTLEAVLDRILPSGVTPGMPGAREAGVLKYVETELAKPHLAPTANAIKRAMKGLEQAALARGAKSFAAMPVEMQRDLVTALADGTLHKRAEGSAAVFQVLVAVALEGYLCDPHHGGNAGGVGWRAIGLDAACHDVHPSPVTVP